jgi:hypothetical protein
VSGYVYVLEESILPHSVICRLDLGTIPTFSYIFALFSILFNRANLYITITFLRLHDIYYMMHVFQFESQRQNVRRCHK